MRLKVLVKAIPAHLVPKIIVRRDGHTQTYHVNMNSRDAHPSEVGVSHLGNDKLAVHFGYDPDLVKKVKTVPGARFNGGEKHWEIPSSSFEHLENTHQHLALTEKAKQHLESIGHSFNDGAARTKDAAKDPNEQLKKIVESVKLPALEGSDKQVKWATDIRESAIAAVAKHLNNEADVTTATQALAQVTSSRWWIDNRDKKAEALLQSVLDAKPADMTPPQPQQEAFSEFDDDGFPKVSYAFQTDVSKLASEQVVDATRIMAMYQRGNKGMVLANGTGTGKTYVYATALSEFAKLGKKPLLFVPNKDTKAQTEDVLNYMGVPSDRVTIATYDDLSRNKFQPDAFDVVIFDEAHKIKKMYGGDRSKRAGKALEFIKQARFTLFATATPFEHPSETKYLSMSGLLPKGMKFDDWITSYGVDIRMGYNNAKEYHFVGKSADLKRLHDDMKKTGFMTKRVFEPKKGLVSSENPELALEPKWLELMDEVSERLEVAANNSYKKGLIKAQKTMLLRQILERAKLEASIPLIRQELDAGRSVAVFTQYRAEKKVADDLDDNEDIDGEVTQEIKEAMKGLEFQLESPTEKLKQVFPEAELYTGAQTEAQLKKAKTRFNSGEAKLLVLTGAKGGTGLSFHDTVGDRPTSQVIITLPWSATELDQMTGRVVRKGLASDTKILLPVSQAGFERKLSTIIGAKMQMMGYAVRGGEAGVSQEVLDAFEYGFSKTRKGAIDEMLSGVAPASQRMPVMSSPGLEDALPKDMFGNVIPAPQPKVAKPKFVLSGGGSYKNREGYKAEERRYLKKDGKTYTKTVYVKQGDKPNRSNEQFSLWDYQKRKPRVPSQQLSLFAKAKSGFVLHFSPQSKRFLERALSDG